MQRQVIQISLALILLASTAMVSASQATLERFINTVQTLEADFEQRVKDERGMLMEFSKGKFSLSRPGRFRWDYDSQDPDLPQGTQIIADGESIFMYDPDLEQVTQRSMEDALTQVPSLVLVQQKASLQEHFTINDIGMTDDLSWVVLRPNDEDAGYQQLMIGFAGERLASILLTDALGNETELSLRNVRNNPSISQSRFNFAVPEGADLLAE